MNKMAHKGYGRIYVKDADDIENVKSIIKDIDEFEYEYMPDNFVTTFHEYPKVIYTHKFSDMDMDQLTATCWSRGIYIWVFNSGSNEYPRDLVV